MNRGIFLILKKYSNIKNQINEIDNLMLRKLDELEKLQNQGRETISIIAKKEKKYLMAQRNTTTSK